MRVDRLKTTRRFYLSDGGLETYMIFDRGYDLPCFSAAALLDTEDGRAELAAYFESYAELARKAGRGSVMDVPTWRAGIAWAGPLGLDIGEILDINKRAVAFMGAIRDRLESASLPIVLNGLVGPAGDAYAPDQMLAPTEAQQLHTPQISVLAAAGVDMVSAMTLTHAGEASGIARAARDIGLPVVIAFTLETDGHLPSGQSLRDAIAEVDAASDGAPIYYMINCAHPDHFRDALDQGAPWTTRIGGIRANASRMSHAELDACEELDDGDPVELGLLNAELVELLPSLRVIGGCCGTDHRHVGCIAGHDHARSAA